ncbi:cell division protein DivIVA [Candidatus Mycobacterium methanotrophicum]|uniref:Cell division protein DivIVA n=1 Tax=Candidatus Mycobacterium methanotrophicum TaxID=2943498 RepID=A0ABY4QQH8_9MYCO|nr:cell division protein DivIVA [Candidatus Mycobacterium methanotrophicum]UQX13213.1 cell division protein DivIVA [Candidatus Mycobacterium methanotrophicum]
MDESTTERQSLLDEIEHLTTRLKKYADDTAALRKEVALLNDTSSSPHAMAHRIAKLLRHAVDEVAQMRAEAQAEVAALVATIESEGEAARQKHDEMLADVAAQRSALEAECAEAREKLEAELAGLRADAHKAREQLLADANKAREQLLADANREADDYREQARRAADEANLQRIKILEDLMLAYRGLESVPATLESAYRDRHESSGAGVVLPFEQKTSAG